MPNDPSQLPRITQITQAQLVAVPKTVDQWQYPEPVVLVMVIPTYYGEQYLQETLSLPVPVAYCYLNLPVSGPTLSVIGLIFRGDLRYYDGKWRIAPYMPGDPAMLVDIHAESDILVIEISEPEINLQLIFDCILRMLPTRLFLQPYPYQSN